MSILHHSVYSLSFKDIIRLKSGSGDKAGHFKYQKMKKNVEPKLQHPIIFFFLKER